jgi:DNA-binding NtrC family response regulator
VDGGFGLWHSTDEPAEQRGSPTDGGGWGGKARGPKENSPPPHLLPTQSGTLESELFGHEKGAFTHALYRRIGRFEEASGGALFLDEIGDLAPSLQAKLLRALQERTIERLGSNVPIRVDIRLIAATSRDLERAVAEGVFREDLYYRLNVVTLFIPPLRERQQDIPALVEHILGRAHKPVSITPEALTLLCAYDWPGNVRQLENAVERAIVLARNGVITEEQIELNPNPYRSRQDWREQLPLNEGYKRVIAQVEKALVERALREAQGNKTRAAEILGIQRRLLYEKMREHKIGAGGGQNLGHHIKLTASDSKRLPAIHLLPAASQRVIKLNQRQSLIKLGLCQVQLRREVIALAG